MSKNMNSHEETRVRKTAGTWGYALQIIYQVCAGAVTLTDCVFWFVLYPFLTSADYRLSFMDVSMHSINAVFLLGDVFLNGLVALSVSGLVVAICSYLLIERYSTSQIRSFTLFWQCENAGSPGTPSMHSSAVSAADTAVLDALSLLCHCKMT
ncbi:hypothetical protein RHGRI_034359 [Rhododendron griersonianum]|uniref:Uncharacterized protein n=1 Tax=Rhododendron griersonianum TaxID=479676 RepID=A0AAV6I3L0_9ERIC|nr:hypothetical protein RHGRI_034359 [Rhododendron griersonianum]